MPRSHDRCGCYSCSLARARERAYDPTHAPKRAAVWLGIWLLVAFGLLIGVYEHTKHAAPQHVTQVHRHVPAQDVD